VAAEAQRVEEAAAVAEAAVAGKPAEAEVKEAATVVVLAAVAAAAAAAEEEEEEEEATGLRAALRSRRSARAHPLACRRRGIRPRHSRSPTK
jgi:hypothetical protein